MTFVHKYSEYLIWVLVLVVLSVLGYLIVDAKYPPKLLVFDDNMARIDRAFTHSDATLQTFYPGDILPLKLKGHRYTNDMPIMANHLVYKDHIVTVTSHKDDPDSPAPRTGKGPFDFTSLSRRIPSSATEGIAVWESTYTYPPRNFLVDSEVYVMRTEPFMILANKVHDDAEDEALIRRILKELKVKTGPQGPKGEKGDKGDPGDPGKRGPGLFGK
jgi:hypothetical protein